MGPRRESWVGVLALALALKRSDRSKRGMVE